MNDDLSQAIGLLRAGDKTSARQLLLRILRRQPQNEPAWLWLAETFDDVTTRRRVLEECLRHNPQAQMAQRGLAHLDGLKAMASPLADVTPEAPTPPRGLASPQGSPRSPDAAGTDHPAGTDRSTVTARPAKSRTACWLAAALWIVACCVLVGGMALLFNLLVSAPVGQAYTTPLNPQVVPRQVMLPAGKQIPFERRDWPWGFGNEWTITPQATYLVTARLLSKTHYSFDTQARLVPYDFALGWGDMSDPAVDEWISWRQDGRWYYYNWTADSPYSGDYIRDHSSNTHLIPANTNLEKALGLADPNDIVQLEGQLVNIEAIIVGDRFWINSSLTRSDTGNGACELLFVQRLVVDGMEYR